MRERDGWSLAPSTRSVRSWPKILTRHAKFCGGHLDVRLSSTGEVPRPQKIFQIDGYNVRWPDLASLVDHGLSERITFSRDRTAPRSPSKFGKLMAVKVTGSAAS